MTAPVTGPIMRIRTRRQPAVLLLAALLTAACSSGVDNDTRMQIAREHEMRGDYITAILELKNIVQADPQNVAALLQLGRLSQRAGQSADAVRYLEQAAALGAGAEDYYESLGRALLAQGRHDDLLERLDPDNFPPERRARIWLLRGAAHLGLGAYAEAEKAYRSARFDRSVQAESFAGLAQLAIADGRDGDAEVLIDAAIQADPFSVAAHRNRGALRLQQERYGEALNSFVQAIEATRIRPGSDDLLLARVGLTEAQWRLGQKSRALGNVKDLLDSYPWHPVPRFLRALLAYDSGEFALAAEYAREVLVTVPSHAPSLQLLAAAESALGNDARCELLLRDYLDSYPGDLAMRRLLATTHLKMGNPSGAIAVLLPGLETGRGDAAFLALLGRAQLHNGNPATAAAYLSEATRLAPGDPALRARYALALIEAGHLPRARRELQQLEPGTEARELLELRLLLAEGRADRALELAKNRRQDTPSDLHAMLTLARLAHARGDAPRAIDWLEMAASRNTDAVEPRLLLVRHYHAAGDHAKAHAMALEAVQVRPRQADALVALAREQLDLGQTAAALRTFAEALRASPEAAGSLRLAGGRGHPVGDPLARLDAR